jgi:hypothetical protein
VSHSHLDGRPDLLEHEREIPSVRATERARALVRARAALVAGLPGRAYLSPPPSRWAAVGVGVWLASAAVGAAAYQVRAHLAEQFSERAPVPAVHIAMPELARSPAPRPPIADAPPTPAIVSSQRVPSQAEAARTELRLLRQARAAVAREDYAAALPPIAEHMRRFKDGRLTEEREALRVKALAGVGRIDEAQRAAEAFRARFSRSVLLPVVANL